MASFFPRRRVTTETVDRTSANLTDAAIGSIGGALFGAALAYLVPPAAVVAGEMTVGAAAAAGAKVGALQGAAPGLTREAADQFDPPTVDVVREGLLGRGLIDPDQRSLGAQSSVNYMAQFGQQGREQGQYRPGYLREMQRYGT